LWTRSNPLAAAGNPWTDSASTSGCGISFIAQWPATRIADILRSCFSYDNTSNPDYNVYTATVRVSTLQTKPAVEDAAIQQSTTTSLRFSFLFQRQVSVAYQPLSVSGFVISQSIVSEQVFNQLAISSGSTVLYPADSTTIRLFTVVQYPYMLVPANTGSSSINNNADYSITSTVSTTTSGVSLDLTCSNTPDTFCHQLWEVVVAPKNTSICDIEASIAFNFSVTCVPGFTGTCGGTTQDMYYSTSYTLKSNNFCVQVVESIGVTGHLTPYASLANYQAGTTTSSYIFGQHVFFAATLSSTNNGPSVSSATTTSVSISSNNQVLSFPPLITDAHFSDYDYQALAFAATIPGFSFLLNQHTVSMLNAKKVQNVTVTATFNILFANLQSETHQLRFENVPLSQIALLANTNNDLSLSANLNVVDSLGTNPSDSSTSAGLSSETVALVAGIVVGCVLVVAVAGAVLYQRRQQLRFTKSEHEIQEMGQLAGSVSANSLPPQSKEANVIIVE